MKTFTFPSKSNPTASYTVTIAGSGQLSCNCRGWTMRKMGQPRSCTHTKHVVESEGLIIENTGEYQFVISQRPAAPAPAPKPVAAVDQDTISVPSPMLASIMADPVTGDEFDVRYKGWVMEEKLDGHRCMIRVMDDKAVHAWSRPKAGKTALPRALPLHIVQAASQLPPGIYDGELRLPGGHSWDVPSASPELELVLFDVLWLHGVNQMVKPYAERRWRLVSAVEHVSSKAVKGTPVYPPSWMTVKGIWANGGEGTILKRPQSVYHPGMRSPDWIKVVPTLTMTMTITGFTKGKNGPYSTIDVASGNVISSVKTLDNATMRLIERDPQSYIGRRLVVKYREMTTGGNKLRHPMWDHMAGEGE